MLGRLELCNCVLLRLFKKGIELIVPFLKVVKTSVLFNDIRLELFIKVSELFSLFPGLGSHLSPHFALFLNLLYSDRKSVV